MKGSVVCMFTVTQRAGKYSQPRGGFLKPSSFEKITLRDDVVLSENENIDSSLIGLAVDYMVRYLYGNEKSNVFNISLAGAKLIGKTKVAKELINNIKGLDKKSIVSLCKLVGFDAITRVGINAYRPIEYINPNEDTINNIIFMINRTKIFLIGFGPIIKSGGVLMTDNAEFVKIGEFDFITNDALWDLKVIKKDIQSKHTLQLLIYYLIYSRNNKINNLKRIGIYNPRKNVIYIKNICEIDKSIIDEVNKKVIGYK